MRINALIIYILLLPSTLNGQTLPSLLREVEKFKTPLFDNSIEDWNKAIFTKKQCIINNNSKRYISAICYSKDSTIFKLKIIPIHEDRRMQICFIKSDGFYIGRAFSGGGDYINDTIRDGDLFPLLSSISHVEYLNSFKNIYLYIPVTNDLYVINYTEHNSENDIDKTYDTVFDASYYVKQLKSHIVAIYYFKADLLSEQKYILPACALGIFGLEEFRFQYTEAKRLLPIVYSGAPKVDYDGIKRIFFRNADIVTNAYYLDYANKTACTTNFPLDSLQQFDLKRLKIKNFRTTPIPDNSLRVNFGYTEKFDPFFDILYAGKVDGIMRSGPTSFRW